ncbi:hypothetical protein LXL04_006876 [Taraxacum kok-saghyz]
MAQSTKTRLLLVALRCTNKNKLPLSFQCTKQWRNWMSCRYSVDDAVKCTRNRLFTKKPRSKLKTKPQFVNHSQKKKKEKELTGGAENGNFCPESFRHLHSNVPESTETNNAQFHTGDACPYFKFAHLTANQAIIEATENADKIHIVDFGIVRSGGGRVLKTTSGVDDLITCPKPPKSDGESLTQVSHDVDRCSMEEDKKETCFSGHVVPGHDPIEKSKVVHWKKWDRWGANVYKPTIKHKREAGQNQSEQQSIKTSTKKQTRKKQ